jgi:hypothetical protein
LDNLIGGSSTPPPAWQGGSSTPPHSPQVLTQDFSMVIPFSGSSTPPPSPQVPAGQEQYQYDQWQAPSPQALHMAQMPPMFGMPITPSNMSTASTASTPTGGLMAIAMPQAAGCDMSGEQIAAELRAVQPECYED